MDHREGQDFHHVTQFCTELQLFLQEQNLAHVWQKIVMIKTVILWRRNLAPFVWFWWKAKENLVIFKGFFLQFSCFHWSKVLQLQRIRAELEHSSAPTWEGRAIQESITEEDGYGLIRRIRARWHTRSHSFSSWESVKWGFFVLYPGKLHSPAGLEWKVCIFVKWSLDILGVCISNGK